jgi:hypothetical protein
LKDWRAIVGVKWEVGLLAEFVNKERWDAFVKKNEILIYYAMLNDERSRKRLSLILDNGVI